MANPARVSTLQRFWRELGDGPLVLDGLDPDIVPLPSRLAVSDLAWASVTAAALAASALTDRTPRACIDPTRIAVAFQSDRHLRVNGVAPDVWSPLSRFWPTADGWVRTHGNYPHHATALRVGLRLRPDASPDDIGARLRTLSTIDAAERITAVGGLCVAVQRENPAADAALSATRMIPVARTTDAPAGAWRPRDSRAPLRGIRVLDLTRVIAGPVATRTLALLGADVLRIDPPQMPEPPWQHLDTGHGKRTALLDITADPKRWAALLRAADVVVLGYRADGLARLGLTPEALHAEHPHLVIARLTAWGSDQPSRRGFDSLVQAATGISWIESTDQQHPGALPAQVLDHSAGYLLAAGICSALRQRAVVGGGWLIETSLRRIAAELLQMPRTAKAPDAAPFDARPHLQTFDVDGDLLTTAAPAVASPGGPDAFSAPRRWGSDRAEWPVPTGGSAPG